MRVFLHMKRASISPPPYEECSILTFLLNHCPTSLACHVLGYAYRSANSLARTCRILRAMSKERAFWRYACARELRTRLQTHAWPEDVVREFCERFDPFFTAWPKRMPGVAAHAYGDALAWIWHEECFQVERMEENFYIVRVCAHLLLHVHQATWITHIKRWQIENYWRLEEPRDDGNWTVGFGGVIHTYIVDCVQPVSFISTNCHDDESHVPHPFWMSMCDSTRQMRYEGLCTADCQPLPIEEYGGRWIQEKNEEHGG